MNKAAVIAAAGSLSSIVDMGPTARAKAIQMPLAIPTGGAASTAALAGAGAGNVDNGNHGWFTTFVGSAPFEESGVTTKSNVLNVVDKTTNGKVNLTGIPLGPAGTTARKIYRTVSGDTGNPKLVGTISDNTTTTFQDNVADAGLGANAPAGGWTAASLTLQGSDDGVNFADIYTTSAELTFTVAANHIIGLSADQAYQLSAFRWLKLRSGTGSAPVTQLEAHTLYVLGSDSF
jgi:hypothetical protein